MNDDIREKAKKLLANKSAKLDEIRKRDVDEIIQELVIHQAELEIQNEELRKAQNALEESRNKYFDLYDLAPVGYISLDEEGKIALVNLTAANILGVEREQLQNRLFNKFVAERDSQIFYVHFHGAFESGESSVCEVRLAKPGGKETYVRVQSAVHIDAKTGEKLLRSVISDISALKKSEKQLDALQEKFRFLSNLPDPVLGVYEGNIIFANDSCESFFGKSRKTLSEKNVYELVAEEDVGKLRKTLESAGRIDLASANLEIAFKTKKGESSPALVSANVASDDDKSRILVVKDIRERKQYEKILQENEEKFRKLFEVSSDAVLLVDAETEIIVDANLAAAKLYEYEPIKLVGKPYSSLLVDDSTIENLRGLKSFRSRHKTQNGVIIATEVRANDVELEGKAHKIAVVRNITETLEYEIQLKLQKEEFETIFNSVRAMIWYMDKDNRILRVNDQFCETLQVTREEVFQTSSGEPFSFLSEDFTRMNIEDNKKIFETGKPVLGLIKKIELQNGEPKWIFGDKIPYKNEKSEIIGIVGFAIDITERKIAEETLSERERFYELLFNSSPDGIVISNKESRILDANQALLDMLGYTKDELIGRDFGFITPKRWLEHERNEIPLLLESGDNVYFEKEYKRKDGSTFPVAVSGWAIKDAEGATKKYGAFVRDITDLKAAEDSLKESHGRMESILKALPDAVFIIDEDLVYNECLTSNEEILLIAPNKIIGKKSSDILPAEVANKLDEVVLDIIRNEKTRTIEYSLEIQGETKWFEGRGAPLAGSEISGKKKAVFIVIDISERKKAQEAIFQAKEAAEESTRVKSEFMANISHEIRTPLNGILGMTELTLMTDLAEDQKEFLETVKKSANHLLDIINDILDFSKIEAGSIKLDKSEFNLRETFETIAKNYAKQAQKKNLEFVLDIESNLPQKAVGDRIRINQIVANLLSNSIKFTHEGEIKFSVKLKKYSYSNFYVEIQVADTGIGIADSKIKDLFNEFYQIDSSATRKYGGTGLGLAITKNLVELMNGEVRVETEDGRGSVFTCEIMLAKSESSSDSSPAPIISGSDFRVLIIEDVKSAADAMEKILRNWNIHSERAENGFDAFIKIEAALKENKNYDLVFTDMKMPFIDGYKTIEKIRKEIGLESIPIVATVEMEDYEEAKKRLADLGVPIVLKKPVLANETLVAINYYSRPTAPLKPKATVAKKRGDSIAVAVSDDLPRALVVEDNPTNRQLTCELIAKKGFAYDVAENGAEAVEKFISSKYDIVLMDLQMPEMDGYEATMEIRKLEKEMKIGRTPVIALSAYAMKEDMQKSVDAGLDYHLAKPFKKADLFKIIDKYFVPDEKNENEAPIDLKTLLDKLNGDKTLADAFIENFLEIYPLFVLEIEKMLDENDIEEAESIISRLGDMMDKLDIRRGVKEVRFLKKNIFDIEKEKIVKLFGVIKKDLEIVSNYLRDQNKF